MLRRAHLDNDLDPYFHYLGKEGAISFVGSIWGWLGYSTLYRAGPLYRAGHLWCSAGNSLITSITYTITKIGWLERKNQLATHISLACYIGSVVLLLGFLGVPGFIAFLGEVRYSPRTTGSEGKALLNYITLLCYRLGLNLLPFRSWRFKFRQGPGVKARKGNRHCGAMADGKVLFTKEGGMGDRGRLFEGKVIDGRKKRKTLAYMVGEGGRSHKVQAARRHKGVLY